MLNAHFKRTSGEIISYGGGVAAPEYGNVTISDEVNIFTPSGQINKKIRLRDSAIVPLPPTLINASRCGMLLAFAENAPKGNFVELGVYRGGTAWKLLEIANLQDRELHVFDTFTGIPYKGALDLNQVGDFGDVDLEEVKELLPEAIFHIGLFPDTLTSNVQDIAFIHCDMDTYQATKSVKPALWRRMVLGGLIFFDDIDLAGVRKAIEEDFPNARLNADINMMIVIKE